MNELIHNFGIDWRLLLAQGVNFLILLYVLKRFAYAPLIALMNRRRLEIERGLHEAREADAKHARIEKEREAALKRARQDGHAIVSESERTAKKRKKETLEETRKKAEGIIEDAKKLIREEKAKMSEDVQKNAEQLVQEGIMRVLGKMEPEQRDAMLIKEALEELKTSEIRLR